VVSFLRQQNEVLEEEKQLGRYEGDRLRAEMAVLKRTIDSLRSQMASEDERHERAQKEEALFKERKEHQLNLNVIKESNSSLRLASLFPGWPRTPPPPCLVPLSRVWEKSKSQNFRSTNSGIFRKPLMANLFQLPPPPSPPG
jgi:hypothetical protein